MLYSINKLLEEYDDKITDHYTNSFKHIAGKWGQIVFIFDDFSIMKLLSR